MRELTSHKVNPANDVLKIEVMDEPGSGGACHRYEITGFDSDTNPSTGLFRSTGTTILFQNGPIAEVGINGITHETMLAILDHRLECFQRGPFACPENAQALFHIQQAQKVLQARTLRRMAQGVEGTHKPDAPADIKARHPAVQAVLQFFAFAHLPAHLQAVSRPFSELAERIADGPQNAEATGALRKLLEAKDAAVRAVLFKS